MKENKRKILRSIFLGVLIGLLLCCAAYTAIAAYLKSAGPTPASGSKVEADKEDEELDTEKTTPEENEEEGEADKTTATTQVDSLITVKKTDGESVVVTNPNSPGSTELTLMRDGIRYFKIVYPEDSNEELTVIKTLNAAIESKTGYSMITAGDSAKEATYEIVVGLTNRSATQTLLNAMGDSSYGIQITDTKVVIAGKTAYSLNKAVEYFAECLKAGKLGEIEKGQLTLEKGFTYYSNGDSLTETMMSSILLDATAVSQFPMSPSPANLLKGYTGEQGGCSDGTYYYQAIIKSEDTDCIIVKYDLEGNKIAESEGLVLNHANDITYNSKLGYLVVCHNAPYRTKVSYVKPDTLELVKTFEIGYEIFSIDYNAKTDRYAVGISGGQTFRVLDANFKAVTANAYQPTSATQKHTTQGVGGDDSFIYFVLYDGSETGEYGGHMITVYDWDGNFVSLIKLDIAADVEPENISIVGDTIYISCRGSLGADLYKITDLR